MKLFKYITYKFELCIQEMKQKNFSVETLNVDGVCRILICIDTCLTEVKVHLS